MTGSPDRPTASGADRLSGRPRVAVPPGSPSDPDLAGIGIEDSVRALRAALVVPQ